jgi:acylphosphatase
VVVAVAWRGRAIFGCVGPTLCAKLRRVMTIKVTDKVDALHRRTCYFSGRVQGVGFRYTVSNLAMPHNVNGYVRNLPDGRVELVMEGPDGDMDCLVDAIRQKMGQFIRQVDTQTEPARNSFNGFSIKH